MNFSSSNTVREGKTALILKAWFVETLKCTLGIKGPDLSFRLQPKPKLGYSLILLIKWHQLMPLLISVPHPVGMVIYAEDSSELLNPDIRKVVHSGRFYSC